MIFSGFKAITFSIIILFINIPSSQAQIKEIRVGVLFDNPPFSFIASAIIPPTGKVLRGLNVDIANAILKEIDTSPPEIYPMDNLGLLESLNRGHIDIIVGSFEDSYLTSNIYMIETGISVDRTCFINVNYQENFSYNGIFKYIITTETGRDISYLLPSKENITLIETDSQFESLALVDSGKAHIYISDNNISTNYIIHNSGFLNIKEIDTPLESIPITIAVKKSNRELISSIEKAYKKIEDQELFSIVDKWIGNDIGYVESRKKGINYLIGGYYIKSILIVVASSLFILFGIVFWNYSLKRKVHTVTKNLQLSEKKYRHLIESSPDMIHIISRFGKIRLANNIAIRNLGYSKNEITSLIIYDLILRDQKDEMTTFINEAFHKKYSNKEFTLIAKNGNMMNVEIIATMLEGDGGNENLACCFSRDLTERKRLEEELIHSDRLALMGRMAAGIAHEINNPLWIILSNTEDMLSHQLDKDELNECLKSIERNGLRAAKTIEDLLTFARPDSMKHVDIDLKQLAEDSLIFLKQKLKEKKIKVEKKFSKVPIVLHGDENSIQQLLINIILNAIQAIEIEGEIILSVSMEEIHEEKMILMKITDNGKGISEDNMKCIFNPFYTSGKSNGFGLGLFMSKIIIDRHNGRIFVRSEMGKGTVFTVCFPVVTSAK